MLIVHGIMQEDGQEILPSSYGRKVSARGDKRGGIDRGSTGGAMILILRGERMKAGPRHVEQRGAAQKRHGKREGKKT